jgi:hypothetical protein
MSNANGSFFQLFLQRSLSESDSNLNRWHPTALSRSVDLLWQWQEVLDLFLIQIHSPIRSAGAAPPSITVGTSVGSPSPSEHSRLHGAPDRRIVYVTNVSKLC